MMGSITSDMAIHRAGCGLARCRTTVWSSGVSMDSSGPHIPVNGWFCFTTWMENSTSADVMGTPSWNVALSVMWMVIVFWSSDTSHDSARYGVGCQFSSNAISEA